MGERPWSLGPDGIVLTVRLTPKGGRDAIEGLEHLSDGCPVLKVRVRAAASDGEANDALVRVLARALAVPASRIDIAGGRTARLKRIRIAGDAAALAAELERLVRRSEEIPKSGGPPEARAVRA